MNTSNIKYNSDILIKLNKALVVSSYKNGNITIYNMIKDNTVNIVDMRPMALFVEKNIILVSVGFYLKEFKIKELNNVNDNKIKELNNVNNNKLKKLENVNNNVNINVINSKSMLTSDIDIHDINVINNEIYFVSSLLNSICKLTPNSKNFFKVLWKPAFITDIVLEDRCHLNGMCVINNKIKYATAVSTSNIYKGWKKNRKEGGVIIDLETNKIILDKLSMPHSPFYYKDELYFLNSGRGELCKLNKLKELNNTNKLNELNKLNKLENLNKLNNNTNSKINNSIIYSYEVICFIPGFLRGLEIINDIAIVGCSKDRHDSCFRGLELEKLITDYSKNKCGVYFVDIKNKKINDFMEMNVNEIYDVKLMDKLNNIK